MIPNPTIEPYQDPSTGSMAFQDTIEKHNDDPGILDWRFSTMNILVVAVCIAMIVVQIRRLREAVISSRVLMLLFWITVLVWALTSWNWLAIPAIILLLCGVFWNVGGALMILGLMKLSRRFNTGDRFLPSHFLCRPRVKRASPKRLVEYLNHQDYRMREAAVAEIESRDDPELVERFTEIVENDSELRRAALDAIGMVGDISAADTIIGYLEDTNDRVRLHAFGSLTRLRAPETLPIVVEFLTDCRKDNRNPAAYRFISDHGGAAAIGWVWGSAPKQVKRNLVGWLRERVKKEDDASAAVVELALQDSEGEIHLDLEDLERLILTCSLKAENPSWFIDPEELSAPTTTEQVVRLSPALHKALAWPEEVEMARFAIHPRDDGYIAFRLIPYEGPSEASPRERVFPARLFVGLLVRASLTRPFQYRHSNPLELDRPFESRPLLQTLAVAVKGTNLAPILVEGADHGIRPDHDQHLVIDLAVAQSASTTTAVRISNWCSYWETEAPPVVGDLSIDEIFLTTLVEGEADYLIEES